MADQQQSRFYTLGVSILVVTGFVLLLSAIIYAATQASLWTEGGMIVELTWGKVTLLDLYLGLGIVSGLIYFVEKRKGQGKRLIWIWSLWTLALIFTGNLASLLYLHLNRKYL